ncbi:uncharacterized protein METZ01_LOCUS149776 [marine metagenome]|uniref:Uncharacterized protein n=1 Tax=marine metagenome TaxID=408172 RepID=A0A382A750_9ZZZZ
MSNEPVVLLLISRKTREWSILVNYRKTVFSILILSIIIVLFTGKSYADDLVFKPIPTTYRGAVTIKDGSVAEGRFIIAQITKSNGEVYSTEPVLIRNDKYFMLIVSPPNNSYTRQIVKFYLDGIIPAIEQDSFAPSKSGPNYGPYVFDLTFPSVPTPTPTPTATPTVTPTPTNTPVAADPSIYSGEVVIAGLRVQEGSVIFAQIGEYQSIPAIIEKDDKYRNLVIDPNNSKFFGQTVNFYLNGVLSRTFSSYVPGKVHKDFDLIFVGVPTFTPTPTATATFTPTPMPTSTPRPTNTATPTATNTASPTLSPTATPKIAPVPSLPLMLINNTSTESKELSGGQCFGPSRVSLATGIGNSMLMLAPILFLAGYVRIGRSKKKRD